VLLFLAIAAVALVVLFYLVKTIRFHLLEDPAALANETAPAPAAGPDGARNLNETLEAIRRKFKLPALVAAVIQKGKIAGLGAVGVRRAGHAERVTLEDRFHIGSCTKSMTATLCAILIEQGKLRWDTTIAESFPDLADKIRPEYRSVTL